VREDECPSALIGQCDRHRNIRPEFRDLPNVRHNLFGPPLKTQLQQPVRSVKELASVSSAP